MPFDVREDERLGLVVATITGRFDAADIQRAVQESRVLAAARGRNILYDMSGAQPGDVNATDLFWMPRREAVLRDPAAGKARVALVHPAAFAELAQFWETSFRNAGLQARAFVERDRAVEWLRGA